LVLYPPKVATRRHERTVNSGRMRLSSYENFLSKTGLTRRIKLLNGTGQTLFLKSRRRRGGGGLLKTRKEEKARRRTRIPLLHQKGEGSYETNLRPGLLGKKKNTTQQYCCGTTVISVLFLEWQADGVEGARAREEVKASGTTLERIGRPEIVGSRAGPSTRKPYRVQ